MCMVLGKEFFWIQKFVNSIGNKFKFSEICVRETKIGDLLSISPSYIYF